MTAMTRDELKKSIEAFISAETADSAIPIVRGIPAQHLREFYNEARSKLDEVTKNWAQTQDKVPNWIGAAHALAPYEVRRKVEVLEMEWRARQG